MCLPQMAQHIQERKLMNMMLVPRRNFDLFDDIFDNSFFIPKNDNKMMRTKIEEKDNNY